MSITDNLTVANAWVGEAELNLPEAQGEELHALAPSTRRIGIPLFALLFGHRSEDPRGSYAEIIRSLPLISSSMPGFAGEVCWYG